MNNAPVNVGDKVTLKSGGPVMTVQALSMTLAYCAWLVGERLHHGTFEVGSLAAAGDEERRAPARRQDQDGDSAT